MEATSDFCLWGELIPEVLGIIFSLLSLHEKMNVIPSVCKSWYEAATGSHCWREIDIDEWSRDRKPDGIDRMVEKLVRISNTSLRKLCVSGVQSRRVLVLIAENAGSLHTLRLPGSNLSDCMMEQLTSKLSMLTSLDVSYCLKIRAQALELIGKNCKQLEVFCRNMHPKDTWGKPLDDDEALAIASNMPKLKRLDMTYHLISNTGVLWILSGCPQLEHLDLRGCWGVDIGEIPVDENYPALQVLRPIVEDVYFRDEFDEVSDASDYDIDNFVEDWGSVDDPDMEDEYSDDEDFGLDEPPCP